MRFKSTSVSLALTILVASSCVSRKTFHDDAASTDGTRTADTSGGSGGDSAGGSDLSGQSDLADLAGNADVLNTADVPVSPPDAPDKTEDSGQPPQTGGSSGSDGNVATGGTSAGGASGSVATGGASVGGTSGGTGGKPNVDAPVASGGSGAGGAGGGAGGTTALHGNGTKCSVGSECSSTVCADGVCCDKACTGTCEACDVVTSAGTCTTLAANATPRPGRTACTGTDPTCASKCDGKSNACAYPPSSTSCGTASCTGNSYQPAGTCSNGTCNTASPQTCANSCVPSAGGCVACTPGSYQCLGAQPQKCDSSGTWQNYGSRSCTGSCETCASSATTATCTNVTTPPSGKSCNGTDATCKGYCSGSNPACTYPDTSVSCSLSTCSSGTLTTQYCNGAGSCSTVKNQSCGGFPCASGSACSLSCTDRSTTGCMDGYKCVGGNTCAATAIPCGSGGTTCSTANSSVCCESLLYGLNMTTPWTYSCESDTSCTTVTNVRYAASLHCGSKADCPSGQYCCMTGIGCDGTAGPSPYARCTADSSNCRDGTYNWGVQLCDPSLSPTECLTGTCNSQSCVHGVYSCQ